MDLDSITLHRAPVLMHVAYGMHGSISGTGYMARVDDDAYPSRDPPSGRQKQQAPPDTAQAPKPTASTSMQNQQQKQSAASDRYPLEALPEGGRGRPSGRGSRRESGGQGRASRPESGRGHAAASRPVSGRSSGRAREGQGRPLASPQGGSRTSPSPNRGPSSRLV